jgi:hypothetical protein
MLVQLAFSGMQTRGKKSMKSILLASTALVAFAGSVSAEAHTSITTALSATLGYNDRNAITADGATTDNEFGFYWEGNLKTTATATLDNGLTAGAYFEITINSDNATSADDYGINLSASDWVLSLTSDMGGLYFGDTGQAAQKHWASAGDMESDGFSTGADSAVLRGDVTFGGVSASVSYLYDDAANNLADLSVGASGSFGAVTFALGYQELATYTDPNGDFNGDEIFGVSVGGTFAGATVTLAYAENKTAGTNSTGLKASYPVGPVTLTGYYVAESAGGDNYGLNAKYASGPISVTADYQNDQGTDKWALDGSYDVGSGISVIAGVENQDAVEADYYVGGKYDLGGGASLLATYAVDANGDQGDEIGAGDYQAGTTIEVSFTF